MYYIHMQRNNIVELATEREYINLKSEQIEEHNHEQNMGLRGCSSCATGLTKWWGCTALFPKSASKP